MARRGGIQVKIQGDKDIAQALDRLGPQVKNRALRPALREGAGVLRKEMRMRAPDGDNKPHPKYGELRDNIRIQVDRRSDGIVTAIVHTGAAFWARFVEFGTVARRARGFKDGKRKMMASKADGQFFGAEVGPMPARPFFRPAFDGKATEALKRIQDRLGKEVADVARLVTPRRFRRR